MTSSETCVNCGSELLAGAKFCRKCGAAVRAFDRASVTEAETRVFQAYQERGAETQYHDPSPTGPSYLAPNAAAFSAPAASSTPENARLKRHGILWASGVLVILLLIFGVVVALKWTRNTPGTTPITTIEAPPPPVVPPPVPPNPPQIADTKISTELDYPGATLTMEMTRREEGGIRQLTTSDAFTKVVDWYKAKLQPPSPIIIRDKAILSGKGTTAIIKQEDGETTILLTKGVDQTQ